MNEPVESFWDKDIQLHYDCCVGVGLIGGQSFGNAITESESVRNYSRLPIQDKPETYYKDRYLDYVGKKGNMGFVQNGAEKDIINSIIDNDFDINPLTFHASLETALKRIHGEYLASRTLAVIKTMKTYKVKNINAGFALKQMKTEEGLEIVSVHNNSGIRTLGTKLIIAAISLGGRYLECFGPYLDGYYGSYDFEVYRKIPNTKMPNGKSQSIFFMKYKGFPTHKEGDL